MTDNILITAATEREMDSLGSIPGKSINTGYGEISINRLISGIGPVSTAYSIMDYIMKKGKPGLIINIGIAGSYRHDIQKGSIVIPSADRFADLGIDDKGEFIPLNKTGIEKEGSEFSSSGNYPADPAILNKLSSRFIVAQAITLSTATGSAEQAESLRRIFDPGIESMEGAAVYYLADKQSIPAIGIRAVSNMVGTRDRSAWDIDLALEKLSVTLYKHFKDIIS